MDLRTKQRLKGPFYTEGKSPFYYWSPLSITFQFNRLKRGRLKNRLKSFILSYALTTREPLRKGRRGAVAIFDSDFSLSHRQSWLSHIYYLKVARNIIQTCVWEKFLELWTLDLQRRGGGELGVVRIRVGLMGQRAAPRHSFSVNQTSFPHIILVASSKVIQKDFFNNPNMS